MAETAWEVTFVDGIHNQHVVALFLIRVLFQTNIVKIRHIRHFQQPHGFFSKVLALIPPPWLIQLTKILDDELTWFDALFS